MDSPKGFFDKALNKMSKIITITGVVTAISAAINAVLTVTGTISKLMEKQWFQGVFFAISVLFMIFFVYVFLNKKKNETKLTELNNKNAELENDATILKQTICSGLEFLFNAVTIEFIKGKSVSEHKYRFTFKKTCRVIGESKWYSGQVYFNNNLTNEDASEKFYINNAITWDDLNATARIRTYLKDGTAQDHDAEITAVAKSPRYFQFRIRYGTGEAKIQPESYDKLDVVYSYEVPATHWGSYINRTISYFGEPAEVTFQLPQNKWIKDKKNAISSFKNGLTVRDSKLDQDPTVTDKSTYSIDEDQSAAMITVKLPHLQCKGSRKYIVAWNPEVVFGTDCKATQIVKDSAELTAL